MARSTVFAVFASATFVASTVTAFVLFATPKTSVSSSTILPLASYYFIRSALLTAALGLLWHIVALRFKMVGFLSYMTAGGLIAMPMAKEASGFLACALGAAAAAIAWLIRRPDRDAANPANPTP